MDFRKMNDDMLAGYMVAILDLSNEIKPLTIENGIVKTDLNPWGFCANKADKLTEELERRKGILTNE